MNALIFISASFRYQLPRTSVTRPVLFRRMEGEFVAKPLSLAPPSTTITYFTVNVLAFANARARSYRFGSPVMSAYDCSNIHCQHRFQSTPTRSTRIRSPNDEVERRGVALPTNEAALSQSSIPSDVQRRRGPRSLEPIVRRCWRPAESTQLVTEAILSILCIKRGMKDTDHRRRHPIKGAQNARPTERITHTKLPRMGCWRNNSKPVSDGRFTRNPATDQPEAPETNSERMSSWASGVGSFSCSV